MLVASGTTYFGSAKMHSMLLLERQFSVHRVQRSGLTFDGGLVPAVAGRSKNAIVYLLLDGTFEISAPSAQTLVGPTAFVMEEDDFEGADGKRTFVFRSWGEPFTAIDLRAARSAVTLERRGPFEMDAPCLRAAQALEPAEGRNMASAIRTLLSELSRLGVVSPTLGADVVEGDTRFDRLWTALRPMAERFTVLPTLDQVSITSGLSIRQLGRELGKFTSTFRFGGKGWRDGTRRVRLKLALLGLSAADVTLSEVAQIVGYGSIDAMARAFRDADLEPPGEVRAALRRA